MKKLFVILSIALIYFSSCSDKSVSNADVPYLVENIPSPENVDAQVGALDFFSDGRLIAGFLRGEIMIYNPQTKEWKMFAEGLHEPLGIHIVNDSEILVMQRPELTRVKDTDGDGYADLYETVTDDFGITGNYHEFNYGPVIDADGNIFIGLNSASSGGSNIAHVRGDLDTVSMGQKGQMYSAVPYRGWVMKLDNSGELRPYASGLRSPNGMGFDTDQNLFVTENQGDWVGTSALYHIEEGNFYGHPSSLVWKTSWKGDNPLLRPVEELDKMRTKAAVLFPHGIIANSPTQPLLDNTNGKFGPFSGQLLVGEMNSGRIVRVMLEEVQGAIQGACVFFLNGDSLRKGNNRLAFAPDGSLWVGQAEYGWAGSRGIQRIVYTGKAPMDIYSMNLSHTGFNLKFTQNVNKEAAENVANYKVRRYRYQYHKKYGSPQTDLKEVTVTKATIIENDEISLELEELDAGYVYELTLNNISSQKGDSLVNNLICYTANNLLLSTNTNSPN
ncbi:DUF7133 domain-containing protein [Albibacterium indicum]|uniref:DUF7133 domain-containing protein n=1 Tax=Albibacterium indicum TaxID=2292082 RepID=UPI000E4CA810|nr:PQQ-dependent sugar dehydrogenase [Pedobacter indicus]